VQTGPCIWSRAAGVCSFTVSNKKKLKTTTSIMKKVIVNSSNFLANQLHVLLIIISSFFVQTIAAQPAATILADSSYTNYLKNNHEKISIGGTNNFTLFDQDFYNNQLFLVSESHGYSIPHQLDLELFKQINKKAGVRYYLAEIDCSQAYYLNKYLNTGNEDFLKAIYQYWFDQRAQWGCKAGFEKWKALYQYNKTLAKGKTIIVLGLDEAQDLNMNVQRLMAFLAEVKYKNGSNNMLDSLAAFATLNTEKDSTNAFKKFNRRLAADINKNEADYKKVFKTAYFDFSFIVNNIASKKKREEKIFDNFNSLYKQYKLSNEKMYGFWGRFHAMQDSINSGMPFVAMLKNSSLPLNKKIISIPVFCVASASMIPTDFLPEMAQQKGTIYSKVNMVNDDSFIYKVEGIKTFVQFTGKNESVIFKLNGSASPYNKGLNLVASSSQFDKTFNWEGNKKSATTNYFQYAIVVSNSDWAGPYGDNTAK
jgi:hypothetical protein